jgi:hypothetical protein
MLGLVAGAQAGAGRQRREEDPVEEFMEEPRRRTATPESADDGRCTSWRWVRVSRGIIRGSVAGVRG